MVIPSEPDARTETPEHQSRNYSLRSAPEVRSPLDPWLRLPARSGLSKPALLGRWNVGMYSRRVWVEGVVGARTGRFQVAAGVTQWLSE